MQVNYTQKTVKNVKMDIQKDKQIVKGDRLHFHPSGAWEKADIVKNKHTCILAGLGYKILFVLFFVTLTQANYLKRRTSIEKENASFCTACRQV